MIHWLSCPIEHIPIVAGSDLQASECPTDGSGGNSCFSDFLGIHLTSGSSAYLEVCKPSILPRYPSLCYCFQGMWVWLADHDLDTDGNSQISLWSGRGLFSESQGPVWLIGTACALYMFFSCTILTQNISGAPYHLSVLSQGRCKSLHRPGSD